MPEINGTVLSKEDEIERIMRFLEMAKPKKLGSLNHYATISFFKEVDPINIAKVLNVVDANEERYFGDVKFSDLGYRLDVCTMVAHTAEDGDSHSEHLGVPLFDLQRWRRISAIYARGKIRKFCPVMVEATYGILYEGGQLHTARSIFGTDEHGMSRIDDFQQKDTYGNTSILFGDVKRFQIALAVQFNRRYEWRAVIESEETGASISLVTDPNGSKELFKLRDIPEGKARRPHMKNWISEHWRHAPLYPDPEESIRIRQHLRGRTEFTWNGYTLKIIVPPAELELNEKLKIRSQTQALSL